MEELTFKQEDKGTNIWISGTNNNKTVSTCIPKVRYDEYLIAIENTARNNPKKPYDPIEKMKQIIKNEFR